MKIFKLLVWTLCIGLQILESSSAPDTPNESLDQQSLCSNVISGILQIRDQVNNVFEKIKSMETRIDSIASNVSNMNEKIENMESTIKNVDGKLESLQTVVGDIKEDVHLLSICRSACNMTLKRISNIDFFPDILSDNTTMNDKLEEIKHKNGSLQNDIGSIKTMLLGLVSVPNYLENFLQRLKNNPNGSLIVPKESDGYFPLLEELVLKKMDVNGNAKTIYMASWHGQSYSDRNPQLLKIIYNCSDTSLIEFESCYEVNKRIRFNRNRVYSIFPNKEETGSESVEAFCDFETEGGGWTVFQRRGIPGCLNDNDRSALFQKTWSEYKIGFGDPHSDYWLGLEKIHQLTKICNHELLITALSLNGANYQARYGNFSVYSEADKYGLTIGGYIKDKSSLPDKFGYHNGVYFSTIDSDNDNESDKHCSRVYNAQGFWFRDCFRVNLNGMYPSKDHPDTLRSGRWQGMVWSEGENNQNTLKFKRVEMKIRPNC